MPPLILEAFTSLYYLIIHSINMILYSNHWTCLRDVGIASCSSCRVLSQRGFPRCQSEVWTSLIFSQ